MAVTFSSRTKTPIDSARHTAFIHPNVPHTRIWAPGNRYWPRGWTKGVQFGHFIDSDGSKIETLGVTKFGPPLLDFNLSIDSLLPNVPATELLLHAIYASGDSGIWHDRSTLSVAFQLLENP